MSCGNSQISSIMMMGDIMTRLHCHSNKFEKTVARLIKFITIGKNAGISALGIVESRPRSHRQSQGSLPLTPIDQSRVEHTSCDAVSNRLPIRSGSRLARAPPNPLTASWHDGRPTACCPAAGATSSRRDVKHQVSPATQ